MATAHHCILRCLTRLVFEESRSHACVEHVACSCCDSDYALYRSCTSIAPYLSHPTRIRSGFASARPEPRKRTGCRWRFARWERAPKRAVFMILALDTFENTVTGQEKNDLCRRMHLSPFDGAEESQEKNQKWSWSWPCKATTDDEHCTKFSSVHEHGYTWIHWISPQWTGEE